MSLLDRPSVNKSDFFVLTVAETSLDMKQSSQRAACVFASRDITRIQSNTTIETHLDHFEAISGISSTQNQHFTSFFGTPWTFFAQNTAKVYCLEYNHAFRAAPDIIAHSHPGI